jgi:hypothetical protein
MNKQDRIDFAEFAAVLTKELPNEIPFHIGVMASTLRKHAIAIHRAQEHDCITGEDKPLERALREATKYIQQCGLSAAVGGDVRGPSIIIHTPRSGLYNAWGGEGWCVPR